MANKVRCDEPRRCRRCGETKPASDFYASQPWRCKRCHLRYQSEWAAQNPDRVKAIQKRANAKRERPEYREQEARARWLKRYGLTPEAYEALYEKQGGRCAICLIPESQCRGSKGRLAVDHDHRCCPPGSRCCGKCIRGLLCGNCNTSLGRFNDDPETLRRALEYLSC